jgi:hypothetical protein
MDPALNGKNTKVFEATKQQTVRLSLCLPTLALSTWQQKGIFPHFLFANLKSQGKVRFYNISILL